MRKYMTYILPPALTLVFGALYFYVVLPPINLRHFGFWFMLMLMAAVYTALHFWLSGRFRLMAEAKREGRKGSKKTVKRVAIIAAACILLVLITSFITSSRVTRASDYQSMLKVTEADFASDIAELPLSQIPVVDRDVAARLSQRKLGEVVELVSQFTVGDYYSQINYGEKPFRVTPLEYDGIIKWFANKDEGIPYYVTVDMATQETKLVELAEGMKYSPSEYFSRDLERHIRFAYPTKMFENLSFEINDEGKPFWVMSYYEYTFGLFGGKDIAGIILVDAVTGEMEDYEIDEVPQWIDLVYSPDMIIEQADNWGSLREGYFNTLFAQKNMIVTTDGYNYVALEDDVWLYTGITSVVSDESNIGFILVNMRTKEARTYSINGAEEYSAMHSAEGEVQEKGYNATFPILVNVEDVPSYFLSLKDHEGLVKMYAYVSVKDYHIVGVGDTIAKAKDEYLRKLNLTENKEPTPPTEMPTVTGTVTGVATAVVSGNTVYYIEIDGEIYRADIALSDRLPFLKYGDQMTFKADESKKITELIGINLPTEEETGEGV